MESTASERHGPRPTCYRCFRPRAFCLCGAVPSVDNRTFVSIVQHPRESTHPFNTARLAALGLRRARLLVDHGGRLRRDPAELGTLDGAMLLYPHPSARVITELAPEERPSHVVVIDGTWHHARTLYRDIPVLQRLPHLTLPAHRESAFQIRKQPQAHCLSTLEAIVFALAALEPETPGLEQLLAPFGMMQDRQLAIPRTAGRRRKPGRPRESRAIPRSLVEDYASLVVAYAESATSKQPGSRARRELVCCAALRPSSGEAFFRVIRQPALAPVRLAHLGLDARALEAASSLQRFHAEWSEFLGPRSTLCTWNQSTLALLPSGAGPSAGIALKGVYYNLGRFRGSLEDIVQREGLASSGPHAPQPDGARAQRRLHNAVRLVEFLRRAAARRAP